METTSKNNTFKIGTRGSLLAVTQSEITKKQIEDQTSLNLEIQTIKTQGDKITDKPLWQLDGKDFFTKELDEKLISRDIDLVIHSYKDLGSERPVGIELACITERVFPHDILLIKKSTFAEMKDKSEFIVGTSSPRRTTNLEAKLAEYLPNFSGTVKAKNLRGNVNTRIEKLSTDGYDAIVLAMAGLERLARKESSRQVLVNLLEGLDFMILPVKEFPPAASQGALALEVYKESKELKETLSVLNHEKTIQEIEKEREAFQKYGGGCHLAVGVHVRKFADYFLHFHLGQVDQKKIDIKELEGYEYSALKGQSVYYLFKDFDYLLNKTPIEAVTNEENIFVTSSHCFHAVKSFSTLWSAGNRTMRKLVKKGHWVNGSAEGFGHEEIEWFQSSKLLEIFLQDRPWKVLSHDQANSKVGEVLPCYKHEPNSNFDKRQEDLLLDTDIIYWSSPIQFEAYIAKYPELSNKKHACGLGKTYETLEKKGHSPIPCIDMTHLKEITKGNSNEL